MAQLKDSTVTGNVVISGNLNAANVYSSGVLLIPNTASNAVSVYANSGSLRTDKLNFVNTSSISISVGAGSTGNANVSLSAIGVGSQTPLVVTPSSSQDNYNPSGLSSAKELRVNQTADIKITGLQAQTDGYRLIINNTSSDYLLFLEHESASSTAANRFKLPLRFPAFLMPGDTITLAYDTSISRWKVVSWPNQGPAMGLDFFTDFLSDQANTANTRTGFFASVTGGAGTTAISSTYQLDTTHKTFGVFGYSVGTSNVNNRWAVAHPASAGQFLSANGSGFLSVARIALPNTPISGEDYIVSSGFVGLVTSANPSAGANWVYRSDAGVLNLFQELKFANATTMYTNTSGVGWSVQTNTNSPTNTNDYLWLLVYLNANATRATFIYSSDSSSFVIANSLTTTTGLTGLRFSWAPVFLNTGLSDVPDLSLNASAKHVVTDLIGFRHSGFIRG